MQGKHSTKWAILCFVYETKVSLCCLGWPWTLSQMIFLPQPPKSPGFTRCLLLHQGNSLLIHRWHLLSALLVKHMSLTQDTYSVNSGAKTGSRVVPSSLQCQHSLQLLPISGIWPRHWKSGLFVSFDHDGRVELSISVSSAFHNGTNWTSYYCL